MSTTRSNDILLNNALPGICTVCEGITHLACSDCMMDLRTRVYVCAKSSCIDEHNKNCPHELKKELKELRDKLISGDRS